MSRNPFSAQVIQGQFQGGTPTFAVQARPSFGNTAAQRKAAPHVQAAVQQNAPHFHTARRQTTPQPTAPAQPTVRGHATQVPSSVNLSASGPGQALPPAVQQKMEAVFDADFSDVRVHVGPQAQQIGAIAFTLGSNLYFAPGQYNPNSQHGQRLIGHKLTHVVQQRAGRVRNPFGSGVAVVQDPGLEVEADRMGLRAAMAPMPVQAKPQGHIPTTTTRPGAVQQQPHAAPGGRPMAPHVQAAVVQAKTMQPPGQAQQISTGGRPQVIQGKFPGGFTDLGQRIRQAGVIQPKMQNSSMQLPPALTSFQPQGRGKPLPVLVQRKMEAAFGTSFADVRIHEGPEAQQLGAQAFTMGSHIYFAPGQFNPNSPQGQRLLGHELAHVVQQRAGRVRNPFGGGVAMVRDAVLEAEAARMACRVSSNLSTTPARGGAPQQAERVEGTGRGWRARAGYARAGEALQRITLAEGYTPRTDPKVKATGARPNFSEFTKRHVYRHATRYGGKRREKYQCAECKRWFPRGCLHIDHKTAWKDHWDKKAGKYYNNKILRQRLGGKRPKKHTRLAEILAYNDLENLQLLCAGCNTAKHDKAEVKAGVAGGLRDPRILHTRLGEHLKQTGSGGKIWAPARHKARTAPPPPSDATAPEVKAPKSKKKKVGKHSAKKEKPTVPTVHPGKSKAHPATTSSEEEDEEPGSD